MKRKVADLKPHPLNIAIYGKPDAGLRDNLKNFGQRYPIDIDKEGLILSGARRWAGAKALGWTEIECVLVNGQRDEADTKKHILLANAYRGEKNAAIQWREAEAYRELLATGDISREELTKLANEKGRLPPRQSQADQLAAAAAGLAERTFYKLDYVFGDGAELDIARAVQEKEISTGLGAKLHDQIEATRELIRGGDVTATEAEHSIRSAIRLAAKSKDEKRINIEADALMAILKRVRSARDAVSQLRTMNPKIAPRIAVAIAACITEMVMTIESVTTKHRIAMPRDRKQLVKLADIEEADVLSVE